MPGRLLLALASAFVATSAHAQSRPPIIDMHLHASDGSAGWALCVPWVSQVPVWDQKQPYKEVWKEAVTKPPCPDPIWPVQNEEAALRETLAIMKRRNIVGVLSGGAERVGRWHRAAPDRFIASLQFETGRDEPSPDALRRLFEQGPFEVFGEITNQYAGIAPDDPRMAPYWALAEQLDIPVAIHLGEGTLGTAFLGLPKYRARLSSPFQLEDILVRHPRLRVSVMHYASPLVDELIAMLGAYPQLYVDIGGIQWFYPRPYFYRQLREIIDAGFGKRVMFGSDQGDWPGVIEPAIAIIEEAPFLSAEQKRDIFYNNAARFLRLSEEEIARHHGRTAAER
jgi:uncharacterized protein